MIDQQKAKKEYEAFFKKAENDGRIIGLMLSGGRGKGVFSPNSDYDVILISTDEGFEGVKKEYTKTEYVDSLPHSISDFKEYAKMETKTQYDKYTFTHNSALIDKTGELEKLIDEKGSLSSDDAKKNAREALGGYLNSLHRYFKSVRNKKLFSAHLHAVDTIPRIITFLFAIEDRVRPFNDLLEFELENYPLKKLSISSFDFISKIQSIAKNADIDTQKELLEIIRKLAIENGHADRIKDWEQHYFG